MKIPVLTLNKPNLNGRVYSQEAVDEALKKLKGPVYVYASLEEVEAARNGAIIPSLGMATLSRENEMLMADVSFTSQVFADEVSKGTLSVRPNGIGKIEDGKVSDYEIESLMITNDPA